MSIAKDIRFNDFANFNGKSLFSKTKGDKVIWALVVLLVLVSLLAVYSATGTLAYKAGRFYCIGYYGYLFRSPGELYDIFKSCADFISAIHTIACLYIIFWCTHE
jgi:uncharacterized membrane protein